MKPQNLFLILAVGLIVFGGFLANRVQTGNGSIEVKTVRYAGDDGLVNHARLYIPEGVSNENPAPGIVATHGYINSNETQAPFAIEFARRGYVVLAPDQTGHGYSDAPAFGNAFGGINALQYMRTLEFVDADNIGLEGHSMGGWSSLIAAAVIPDGYQSIVIQGSSTGTFGAPEGTPEWPRNLSVVFSKYDEFSQLMWGTEIPADVPETEKLQALFGTDEPVVPGEVYGSIEDGTARVFHQPAITHPANHFSTESVGYALDWFDQTLEGGQSLSSSDQVWIWKEIGTLIALLGMVMLLVPAGTRLINLPAFQSLRGTPAESRALTGYNWWIGAVVFVVLPVVTLFQFKGLTESWGWTPSALLPQEITTQVMVWIIGVGLIALALFTAWHLLLNRKTGATLEHYGLTWNGRVEMGKIVRSFLFALSVVGVAYVSLLLTMFFFDVDYRIWVFGVKPLSTLQFQIALSYVVPFCAFFLVVGVLLHGQLRRTQASFVQELAVNWVLLVIGYLLFLAFLYTPLFMGGTLAIPSEPLWAIITKQFVPLMTIAAVVFTGFYRLTGRVYTGAFINGLLVTWIVVAGQATHYAF
ncbi:MAG: alpha/beta fold hydrolase [Natronospirillum sp.]|uniref:alpha/beta hydrolase family protein n=1 Tax=Natronospirillum sp. TaxID=2812955 RepID=UPI0025D63CB1|nr:alpha/beta fold hydrolase [Natronospirillum sp.]MCH8552528.1 alpha/beta fold hydrolase [Natronospirillum sp.]